MYSKALSSAVGNLIRYFPEICFSNLGKVFKIFDFEIKSNGNDDSYVVIIDY